MKWNDRASHVKGVKEHTFLLCIFIDKRMVYLNIENILDNL